MNTRLYFSLLCLLCLPCLPWVALQSALAQQPAGDLITIEVGDLPIILSAPHGGTAAIPGVPERRGEGVESFVTKSDSDTNKLTEMLAKGLEDKLGKRPYVVIARFHRKYLDVNRRDRNAYESPNAKPVYDTYHHALAKARAEVIEKWGFGILFDIHGQSAEPRAVLRGTQNGKTTTHLVNRFGRESLSGRSSVFGRLAAQDVPVFPGIETTDLEHVRYNGGYIVTTYGSNAAGTLDAIQLEFGSELRAPDALPSTASKLANSIAEYAQEYLPKTKLGAQLNPGEPRTGKVRVGVYCDVGAGNSSKDLLSVLETFNDVDVQRLMADDMRAEELAKLDVLIHPGGSGGSQGRHLGEEGRKNIRTFIDAGGGFIGICAGAYLASADYAWSLNVLDAKVVDREHWARGTGTVEIALTDAGRQVLKSKEQKLNIFYGQGPLLAPGNKSDIPDYETLAAFKTEIAKNGAPAGVMAGTTAIAKGQFGRGRVLCFSPHPELTKGLEPLVRYAIEEVSSNRLPEQPGNRSE